MVKGDWENRRNWPPGRYLAYKKQLLQSNATAKELKQQAEARNHQAEILNQPEGGAREHQPPAPNAPSPATRARSRPQVPVAADSKLMAAPVQPCDRANPYQALKKLANTLWKHSPTARLLRFVIGKNGRAWLYDRKDIWSPPFVT